MGTFRKAAEGLNLLQPALSRRIQSLEAELGAPLLERSTRHMATTAFGREIEPLAQRLIDESENQPKDDAAKRRRLWSKWLGGQP